MPRKLGKTSDQRRAMLRQQVTDFLDNGKMETTITRAKEIKPLAEKMITLGKKNDLAAYRQALTSSPGRTCARSSLRKSLLPTRSATAVIPGSSVPVPAAAMLPKPLSLSWSEPVRIKEEIYHVWYVSSLFWLFLPG